MNIIKYTNNLKFKMITIHSKIKILKKTYEAH